MSPHDVGTTPRKPLSPKQRLALFEREKGLCCLCGDRITDRKWIDEHKRALGLGGSNDPDNRGIAHIACADLKTHGPGGDKEMIDDAKRSKRKHLGIKPDLYDARPIPTKPMPQSREAAEKKAKRQSKPSQPAYIPRGFEPASKWSR